MSDKWNSRSGLIQRDIWHKIQSYSHNDVFVATISTNYGIAERAIAARINNIVFFPMQTTRLNRYLT